MSAFTTLGSTLDYTGSRLASLTKKDPAEIPSKELKEATQLINKANTFLKTIKEQPIPEFNQKNLQSILKNIDKIKKKTEIIPKEERPDANKKLENALSRLSRHLTDIKTIAHEKRCRKNCSR